MVRVHPGEPTLDAYIMYEIRTFKTTNAVDIVTTNTEQFFSEKKNKLFSDFLDILPAGNYTVIDFETVNLLDFITITHKFIEYIRKNNLEHKNIVLVFAYECYANNILSLILNTLALHKVKNVLVLDGGIDTVDKLVVHFHKDFTIQHKTIPYWFKLYNNDDPAYNVPDKNKERSIHYCSLARIARPERVKFTNLILANQDVYEKGLVTCGWGSYDYSNKQWTGKHAEFIDTLIPVEFADIYPLSLEDADRLQHTITNQISDCAVNVILEGEVGYYSNSYAVKHPAPYVELCSQNDRLFFTEKTAKAFVGLQLPLFVAPAGFVQQLRNFGFDVFDDFFDHSYDRVDDVELRINMAFKQLEKVCNKNLQELNEFLHYNLPRLHNNRYKLVEKTSNFEFEIIQYINNNFA